MMTKADHIAYWKRGAARDLETARQNIGTGQHVPALFFFHLATEKLLKALWVKENVANTPPFTHDLQKLARSSGLQWDANDYGLLRIINSWNIEARYPDYLEAIYRVATLSYVQQHQQLIATLHQWLLSNL